MDSLNGSYDKSRSPSGYAPGRGAGPGRGSTFRGTEFNAKTRLCNRWLSPEGCRFGDKCNFAHGEHELRALPPRSPDGFQGGPPAGAPGRGGYAPRGRGGYGYGPGRGAGGRFSQARGGYGYPAGGYGYGMGGGEGGYGGDMGSSGAQGRGGMSEEAWAQSGYPTTGPNGWIMYKTKDTGEAYYHNSRTGVTQWDKPSDWPA